MLASEWRMPYSNKPHALGLSTPPSLDFPRGLTASTFDNPTVLTFVDPAVRKMSFKLRLGDIDASVSTTPLTSFHVTPTSTVRDGGNIGGVNASESSTPPAPSLTCKHLRIRFGLLQHVADSLERFSVGGLNGSSSASTTPFSEFSEAITRAALPIAITVSTASVNSSASTSISSTSTAPGS
ncbi:hypothetical protein GGX14DRAFT_577014 [Mycena pura]|uniref:Uncharacterized protein n=1 Tax=Mycena pura TaxID=153505 RepID=A0AAD6UU89_9AGAR|nr:hypothetical protein GGX14DRAFT_577014 [Mycena pura]